LFLQNPRSHLQEEHLLSLVEFPFASLYPPIYLFASNSEEGKRHRFYTSPHQQSHPTHKGDASKQLSSLTLASHLPPGPLAHQLFQIHLFRVPVPIPSCSPSIPDEAAALTGPESSAAAATWGSRSSESTKLGKGIM
jgi:hypothetical protein